MRNFTILTFFLLLISIASRGQTRLVKGTLTDPSSGEPLPGVNVLVKGTPNGTTTDIDGKYEIEAPIGSVLVFSFVGFQSKEVEVLPEPSDQPTGNGHPQKIFRHTIPDNPERTLSPYFFIKSDDPFVDQMPLKATTVEVNIAGVIANVKVRQVYVNSGAHPLEALYIFPGSTRAAVYAMNMTIGSRRMVAKIREKEQARKDYDLAKQEGKTATLLEQKRPNVFQMNVANIMPGDTISVELKYTEALIPVNGTYEFVYPTVVGPRYSEIPDDNVHAGEKWVETPYHTQGELPNYSFDLRSTLNTGIPIQRITSTSHGVRINYVSKNSAVIELDSCERLGGNRDFILQYRLRGGKIESGLLLCPRQDENFFLLMMEPPEAPSLDQIPPREYIFIVDVSGSMEGFPLGVSKRLLRRLVSSLRPTDRFNVMLFESENRMLHPTSVRATQFNIANAIRLIDMARGGGGTRLYSALQSAFEYEKPSGYSRTFVVVTDGYVTVEKEAFNLVRDNLGTANLFAFGIGTSVNRYLIEGLSHSGMGEPFIVTNDNEADVLGKKFKDLIERPVLTNIKIDYGSFDVYDAVPLSVPDVFVERPVIIFGKYKGKTNGTIRLSGNSGTEPYVNRIDVSSAVKENNEALRYLWARNQIKYLDDFAQFYEDDNASIHPRHEEARVQKITQLGLKYNLLTQYTSFIAIDSTIRNPAHDERKVKQPLPLPQGVSNSAISLRGLTLAPDVTALSEVVVVGYGEQQKRDLTASVQSVQQNDLSNALSLGTALQGRVAGVTVNQTSPGPSNSHALMVRGNRSLSSTNEPLYIVDGVPIDNTEHPMGPAGGDYPSRISDLNPNDMSSIEVLKSGSATAIYGSRGANGVIIITTKKSKPGQPNVNFTSAFSTQTVNRLPELQNTFAQGRSIDGSEQWRGPENGEMFSWGPALSNLTHDGSNYAFDQNGRLIPLSSGATPATPYSPYRFLRKGVTVDNYIDIGNAKYKWTYGASIGDTRQSGVIPGASYNRTTIRLFGETDRDRFKVGSKVLFTHNGGSLIQRGNSTSSVMYGLLTTPPSFDDGNGKRGADALKDPFTYQLPGETQRSFQPQGVDNPYWSVSKNPFNTTVNRFITTIFGEVELFQGITLKSNVSLDQYLDKQRSGFDINSTAFPSGQFSNRDEMYRGLNSELLINGRTNAINGDLEISGMAGLATSFSNREISRVDGFNLKTSGMFSPDNADSVSANVKQYNQNNTRLISSASLKYRSLLSMDLRSAWEKTSTLPEAKNDLWSAGVGLAFNFTELPSLNYSDVLTSGKLFISAGSIQKEAPLFIDPNYFIAKSMDINAAVLNIERTPIVAPSNLKPEQVTTLEVGGTFGFFQNRIELTTAGYVNQTANLLVPTFPGLIASLTNGGTLVTKGFDLTISAMPISGTLQWKVGVNLTKYRSIVKKLMVDGDRIALAGFSSVSRNLIEGEAYGVLFGTRYLRNDQGSQIIGNDGYPVVDSKPGILGNPNPDWIMGVENSLSYKGVSLGLLIEVKQGGVIWNGTKNTLDYYGTSISTGNQRGIKSYVFDGVNENGESNTIAIDFVDPTKDVLQNRWTRYGVSGVAEDGIEDGSWVRLRELSLAYQFADHIRLPIGLRRLTIAFTAKNLFLFTRYSGIDSDTSLTGTSSGAGMDYFNLPSTKSYGFSVKVGF